jgi:hypothetical protein
VPKERAIFMSFAGDAFRFDVPWLGIILIVAAMVLWRRLGADSVLKPMATKSSAHSLGQIYSSCAPIDFIQLGML